MRFGGNTKKLSRREARWLAHVEEVLALQARMRENGKAPQRPSAERPLMQRFKPLPEKSRVPLPLSAVTFEDLRDLGLTATQAATLLNGRYRGEIARMADVTALAELPEDVRSTLLRCLTD